MFLEMKEKGRGKERRAQTIIELTLFGSVILFILGLIIRYAVTFSEGTNVQLKAHREALKLSAQGMEAFSAGGRASRRNASVLWIDDRPTIQGGEKYGTALRTPFMAMGQGALTNQLHYNVDTWEWENLPVFDMMINGQRFTFRTAGFKSFCHLPNCPEGSSKKVFTGTNCSPASGNDREALKNGFHCDFCRNDLNHNNKPMKCTRGLAAGNANGSANYMMHPWENEAVWTLPQVDWSAYNNNSDARGVAVLYTRLPRSNANFCKNHWQMGKHHCKYVGGDDEPGIERRFDLKRDGNIVPSWPPELRNNMTWQWYPVFFTNWGIDWYSGNFSSLDIDGDLKEETLLEYETAGWGYKQVYTSIGPKKYACSWSCTGLSGSWKYFPKVSPPDTSLSHGYHPHDESGGGDDSRHVQMPIAKSEWMDFQEGDIDLSYDALSAELHKEDANVYGPKPGLLPDTRIYSVTSPQEQTQGTLTIDQSTTTLPDLSKERTIVSQKTFESYDIVERKIQLSNNTGCFCPASGPSMHDCLLDSWPGKSDPNQKQAWCRNDNTAVEVACRDNNGNCCDSEDKKYLTCFDYGKKMLYVRSRVASKKGHRFKTIENVSSYGNN